MRKMQMLQEGQKTVRMTTTFRGYNRNDIIADGEMYWTKNLSGDGYPAVRPRKKRGITDFSGLLSNLTGISSLNGLIYILGITARRPSVVALPAISGKDSMNLLR